MTDIIVRPATEADYEPFTKLDFTHTVGDRVLELERSGSEPEFTYSMRWRTGTPREEVYSAYTVEDLHRLQKENDAFLVATLGSAGDGAIVGYAMLLLPPSHHGAVQMNDLAVHKPAQRQGVGRALVDAAAAWGRERGLRAIWASPRLESAQTIDFYLRVGFRASGINDRWNTNADDADGQPTIFMYLELG